MATDRLVYKFLGDATDLIKSSKEVSVALDRVLKSAIRTTKAEKDLSVQSKATRESMSSLATGAGSLAVGLLAAGAAAGKLLQSMADSQNRLTNLSAKTGLATKTLAGLRLAAKGSGQDLESITSILKPMITKMGQIKAGSKSAADAFKAVGIDSVMMGDNLRSADEVLLEITKNLSKMEDPTERAAAAALAFGGAGTKLVQALGGQELQHFVDAAEQFGVDTGPRAAAAAREWEKAMADLDLVMQPMFSDLMEFSTKGVQGFSSGFIYIKTLLLELSKNILPNLGTAVLVLFSDIVLGVLSLADTIVSTLTGAIEGFLKLQAHITGDDKPLLMLKKFQAAQEAMAKALRDHQKEMKENVFTNTELGKAYQVATEKAFAFWKYQIGITKATKIVTSALTDQKAALDALQFGGSASDIKTHGAAGGGGGGELVFGDAGPIIEEGDGLDIEFGDAEIQVRTIKDDLADSSLIIGDMVGQMTNLTDPTGIFRDILTDVAGTMEVLANTDFSSIEGGLSAAASVAKTMGSVLNTVLKEQLKGDEELTKKKRKNLMILFAAQKVFTIASIVMNTAGAIMRALLDLGPIAGGVAAGVIAGIGVAQAVVVASQKAPFHTGGIIPAAPGKQGVEINALPGESVLTREATAGLGAEGVASLNSGGGGQPMVIEMVYKHRIFDNFVQDNISKGGPLRDAIDSGKRVGHRG
jgi:hypothetical protein